MVTTADKTVFALLGIVWIFKSFIGHWLSIALYKYKRWQQQRDTRY